MSTTNELTPELKKAAEEIKHYYKTNPLLKFPFASAAWSFLSFVEDYMVKRTTGINNLRDLHIQGSEFLVELEYSLSWLIGACKPEGQVSFTFNEHHYESANDLFELGKKYESFVFAYTLSNHNWIELKVSDFTIQPTGDFFDNYEYEVYNILIDANLFVEASSSVNFEGFPIDAINSTLRVVGDRFHYKLNPKMVSDTITSLKPLFDEIFMLPSEWQFSRYSLGDFQQVFQAICAIAHIHWRARIMAMTRGCEPKGNPDSLYILTFEELLRRIVRYSGISEEIVKHILDDLTYGKGAISHSELAMRPLIKLNSEYYAIVPHVWVCSSPERNFTALLNRLKSERENYLTLASTEKERLMRERITRNLSDKGVRLVSGNVANLPDVDLAIINDSEKACLLLELKWFIAPTVARERIEKTKEIEKGISQVLQLKHAFADNHRPLLDKLNIDSSYRVEGIVVSQNWIGYANVQSPEVPVIRVEHLIAKINSTESLLSTMEWLKNRHYLPKVGEHFKMVEGDPITIGNWTLKLHAIELLGRERFFPL